MKNLMHTFAAYIMRGRGQAMLVTAACAILSLLIFPFVFPLGQVSAACVALVTLRRGALDGGLTIAGATLISGVLAAISASDTGMALNFILMYVLAIWGPVWVVSVILRYTRALDLALVSACVMGIVIIVVLHLYIGDVTAWWTDILTKAFEPMLQNSRLSPEEADRLVGEMAGQMTGSLAAGFMLGVMTSLFLARWWQAMLYYPGGFRKEFRTLRLDRRVAVISAVIAVLSFVPVERITDVSHDIFIVVIAAYMLHGLSLAHTLVSAVGLHVAWLVIMYLMVIFLPPVRVLVAAAGFADSWINLRSRFGGDENRNHPAGTDRD
jgi:hypothetical protein